MPRSKNFTRAVTERSVKVVCRRLVNEIIDGATKESMSRKFQFWWDRLSETDKPVAKKLLVTYMSKFADTANSLVSEVGGRATVDDKA